MSNDVPETEESLAVFLLQRMTATFAHNLTIAPGEDEDNRGPIAAAVMGAVAEQPSLMWLAIHQQPSPEGIKEWLGEQYQVVDAMREPDRPQLALVRDEKPKKRTKVKKKP